MDTNAFAAGIPMPEDEVLQAISDFGNDLSDDDSKRAAARKFGVSIRALSYRFANLRVPIDGVARL